MISHLRHCWVVGLLAAALASNLAAQTEHATTAARDEHADAESAGQTTIGGYGEITYVDPEGSPVGVVDVPRFVLFMEHEFNEDINFFAELEVEHTKLESGSSGEVALEQAYLQYRLSDAVNVRAGLLVLPVGIINEFHEPPTFNGVMRPQFDELIIPTTWREIGVGLVGRITAVEGLQYRAYLTSGLNAAGFSGVDGIHEGHLEGAEAEMRSLALSARVEYLTGGLRAGVSFYHGGSAFGNTAIAEGLFGAPVTMYGLDAQFNVGDLSLRGIILNGSIAEAGKINDLYHARLDSTLGRVYADPIGSGFGGGYIEAAYNIAKLFSSKTSQQLSPFVRFEKLNTNASMPNGITAQEEADRTFIIAGLTFRPVFNVAFKLDWTIADDASEAKIPGTFALGAGYNF